MVSYFLNFPELATDYMFQINAQDVTLLIDPIQSGVLILS
jgi:hypothetical protein